MLSNLRVILDCYLGWSYIEEFQEKEAQSVFFVPRYGGKKKKETKKKIKWKQTLLPSHRQTKYFIWKSMCIQLNI